MKREIELPCNINDIVFCIVAGGRLGTIYTAGEVIERAVDAIIFDGKKFEIHSKRRDPNDFNFWGVWGDVVFATRFDAEKRIAEIKEGV